ncbi:hypothetical protein F4802DRAFT_598026 [Xylaria palmicola]|nr:hypothetical protein F4802DRAFT_598026 [Xylaria palmicola]
MDGPSSRFPSTSVASSTSPDPGPPFSSTPRQSFRELLSSVTSTPTTIIDPPRPAKEGYEWVWFPGGYWAERQIAEMPPRDSLRVFKWRKRSGKSSSESPSHSPRTPLTAPLLAERTERSPDYSAGQRSLSRTPASSESGGSWFPLNRMPDAPLPSPYLTEEAHVQSLQWPSIDAAARHGSVGGSSMFRSRAGISPSPLQFSSAEDEADSDKTVLATPGGQAAGDASPKTTNKDLIQRTTAGEALKPKKSFISWRMLSDHRQRMRRSQNSSDDNTGEDTTHTPPLRVQASAKSPLRKGSTVSDKSHRSLKNRSAKLFTKARWSRKISSSSGASTASSMHTSIRSQSPVPTPGSERGESSAVANAWASEYPGGEAMRVETPRITQNTLDSSPRSFFADLTPPSTPRRPLSRQDGHAGPRKPTTLSKSFTPGGDSSTASSITPTTPRPRPRSHDDGGDGGDGSRRAAAEHTRAHPGRADGNRKKKKRGPPVCKEWWEVSVPMSYGAVDQRTFKFDLPEHLPSSPMCPANKRHKSGGTGVCVYHGRARGPRTPAPSPAPGEGPPGGASRRGGGGDADVDMMDTDRDAYGDVDTPGCDLWK